MKRVRKHKTVYIWIFILLVSWVSFFAIGIFALDPDFGWHYAMGKYILLHHAIPVTDPFSYTMPSFPFIDHEWLTNVFIAIGYDHIGIVGLAAVFALFPILTVLLVSKRRTLPWLILPTMLALELLLPRGGIRPQEITWFMLALLLFLWNNKKIWNTTRLFLPLLFVLWANLHGGFFLGIFVLFFILVVDSFQKKKLQIVNLLIVGISVLATFINPYGLRLWFEVWMQLSDTHLHWTIGEWLPFYGSIEIPLFFLFLMGTYLWWKFKKDVPWWESGLFFLLFLAALTSLRNAALFAIISIPYVSTLLLFFITSVHKDKLTRHRIHIFFLVLCGIAVLSAGFMFYENFTTPNIIPTKAVTFLKKHPFRGNLFSNYDWGGYLIWKYPDKKVFVDGRMPSWRWNVWPESQTVPAHESAWAYKDYRNIVYQGEYKDFFKKYNITRILWKKKDIFVKKEWRKIYEDTDVVVLEKVN